MEYIAAALEARGHDVTLVDLRFGRPVEHYLKARPGLVGIAAMHALETENVLDLVARIRRASPQVPLVIGGHTAAAYPAPFVNAAIDAIVLDDGERAVPRLVDALDRDRPWSSVPGVAIRGADGAWVRTPADDDVFELDDVPSPARRHVDRWRRQYACLAHRPDVADRDGARLPVPVLVLFHLAAARAIRPGAVDRIGVRRLRARRRRRLRRRRSVLVSPLPESRAGSRAPEARDPQEVGARAEPRRYRRASSGAARGLASHRARVRYLLRARSGERRRVEGTGQGRDRRPDGRGGRGRPRPRLRGHRATS